MIYLKIKGMHCNHCYETIKKVLLKNKNISDVSFKRNIAKITYSGELDKNKIIKDINNKGYFTKESYFKENIDYKEYFIIGLIIILIFLTLYKILGFNIFNFIPTIDSSITYGMLFVIGLLTSIHCVSMCGAINLLVTKKGSPILYNVGRVLSYSLIGGFVGLIGNVISINQTISGIIIIILSILMLLMSLNMIRNKRTFKIKGINNPFLIGLLNGFMPCGPLSSMQLYALSTGSFIKGALSMFLFGLGTMPLMLISCYAFNKVKGKYQLIINKVSTILILLLSLTMFSRGLAYLNININFNEYDITSKIKGNYQVVKFDLDYDNYSNFIVTKGKKVKLIINVDKNKLTGCNNEIIIFGQKKKLKVGKNVITFTPKKVGEYTYTCWMGMIKNKIKVVE